MKNAAKLIRNKLPHLRIAVAKLTCQEVLVGVPQDEATRETGEMNNATIAYIQDNGSPAQNIPARPFMVPGIQSAKAAIAGKFKLAAQRTLTGNAENIDRDFYKVGQIAQSAIRQVIQQGIAPPLKPGTIRNRWRSRKTATRRKGEEEYLEKVKGGMPHEEAQASVGITPLVNTGQLRNSINYVVRKK